MIVIAEHTDQGAEQGRPEPERPVYYIACDAGYIEAGNPIAGLKPPSPVTVGHALRTALDSAGYQLATKQSSPSLVLVYSYGSISEIHDAPRYGNKPNFRARLDMVAPQKLVQQTLRYSLYETDSNAGFVRPDVRDTLDYANAPRYFVVVSAYDYNELTRQTPTLLWRVRLSTGDNSGAMEDILPTLARASAPYLGLNFADRQRDTVPLRTGNRQGQSFTNTAEPFVNPRMAVEKVYPTFIRHLLPQERTIISGSASAPGTRAALPPTLIQRISDYQHEKAALQAALADKLKAVTPGPDSQRAIDAFNSEYADRIMLLGQTHENIRSDLARFAATNPASADKSLDALLQEFAAGHSID